MLFTNYERFAEAASEKNLSPYKISKDTGVSQATLSYWKNGHVNPKHNTLTILAKYLNIPVTELYNEIQDKEESDGI
ncbi:MAG: family transcriptional regulator [Herbinix sp.]|nr:family transcriptional regulator [Herbinix sp.]